MTTSSDSHTAIFENIGQALHVAFLIMSVEAQQDSPMRKALMRMMEYVNGLTDEQCEWYDQLRGAKVSKINFAGLTAIEVRAQCAMVTSAVDSKLPEPEMWLLQAKYGQMAGHLADIDRERYRIAKRHVDQVNELVVRKRYAESDKVVVDARAEFDRITQQPVLAFSGQRINAIHGLTRWLAPLFPNIGPMAMDVVLAKLFCNHNRSSISYRELAENFGSSHMTYARAYPKIKEHLASIEQQAMLRLQPYFLAQGLIQNVLLKTA